MNFLTKSIISILAGCFVFFLIHQYYDPIWVSDSSIDIFLGAIIEFFVLNLLLQFYQQEQDQKTAKHFENHLRQIEAMMNKAYMREGENDDA